jgi:prefoldin subunit 5
VATKTIEKRVSDPEEMFEDVPRLINMRFAYVRSQLDALDARVSTVEAKVDNVRAELQGVKSELQSVRAEVQAMPRVIAEMLDERTKRGG